MKKFIAKFWDWLLLSSANPDEYSMTIKGVVMTNIGVVIMLSSGLGLPYTAAQITNEAGLVVSLVSAFYGVLGLCRKIYNTVTGLRIPPPPDPNIPNTGATMQNTAMGSVKS